MTMVVNLMSCKKQYSCQCSVTINDPYYSPYTTSSVQPLLSKTTMKRAKKICDHTEEQMFDNMHDYTNPEQQLTVSCAVK